MHVNACVFQPADRIPGSPHCGSTSRPSPAGAVHTPVGHLYGEGLGGWGAVTHIVGIPASPPKSRQSRRKGRLPPLVSGARMRRPRRRSTNSGCGCCQGPVAFMLQGLILGPRGGAP